MRISTQLQVFQQMAEECSDADRLNSPLSKTSGMSVTRAVWKAWSFMFQPYIKSTNYVELRERQISYFHYKHHASYRHIRWPADRIWRHRSLPSRTREQLSAVPCLLWVQSSALGATNHLRQTQALAWTHSAQGPLGQLKLEDQRL